jgi:hypothetical protein
MAEMSGLHFLLAGNTFVTLPSLTSGITIAPPAKPVLGIIAYFTRQKYLFFD